jgi:uridine phosphorylase
MSPNTSTPKVFNILRLKSRIVGPLIVFVKCDFQEKALKKFLKNIHNFSKSNEYSVFCGTYQHKVINFLGTGSGAASLLSALYELIGSDLECMIRIGACGGLNAASTIEIVVPKTAFCVDAVSSVLAGAPRVEADAELTGRIKQTLGHDGIEVVCGDVVSVDAMYLFEKNIIRAEGEGARCWDLETATLLAFGKKFGIKAASVLEIVSDNRGNSLRSYPPIRRLDFVKSIFKALSA